MVEQLRVFVSHSQEDDIFCCALVTALREAGADVWFDEHNLEAGRLLELVQQELEWREIFIVLLSRHAFASRQIRRETVLAYELTDRDPMRMLLPVTVGRIDASDFAPGTSWLFLADFTRIEAADYQSYPQAEAIDQVVRALSLSAAGEAPTPTIAPSKLTECPHELIARGKVLRDQEKFTEALPVFDRATQLARWCFCAWANVGYIRCAMGDYDQARVALTRVALTRALGLKHNAPATWTNLGLALNNLQRYEEALAAIDRALALKQTFVDAWINKAFALNNLQRYEEALAATERALTLDTSPQHAKYAWKHQGFALCGLRRYAEALTALDQSLTLDASSQLAVYAWNDKSWALNNLQRYEEALETSEHALALDQMSTIAWMNKSWALDALGQYQKALAAADQSLILDTTSRDAVYAWNDKGWALTGLGRSDEALAADDQALTIDPSYAHAWDGKGTTLTDLGRHAAALALYDKALALYPTLALNNMNGITLSNKGYQSSCAGAHYRGRGSGEARPRAGVDGVGGASAGG
jgi:tetratricopeptide (TPR) repeat protein